MKSGLIALLTYHNTIDSNFKPFVEFITSVSLLINYCTNAEEF